MMDWPIRGDTHKHDDAILGPNYLPVAIEGESMTMVIDTTYPDFMGTVFCPTDHFPIGQFMFEFNSPANAGVAKGIELTCFSILCTLNGTVTVQPYLANPGVCQGIRIVAGLDCLIENVDVSSPKGDGIDMILNLAGPIAYGGENRIDKCMVTGAEGVSFNVNVGDTSISNCVVYLGNNTAYKLGTSDMEDQHVFATNIEANAIGGVFIELQSATVTGFGLSGTTGGVGSGTTGLTSIFLFNNTSPSNAVVTGGTVTVYDTNVNLVSWKNHDTAPGPYEGSLLLSSISFKFRGGPPAHVLSLTNDFGSYSRLLIRGCGFYYAGDPTVAHGTWTQLANLVELNGHAMPFAPQSIIIEDCDGFNPIGFVSVAMPGGLGVGNMICNMYHSPMRIYQNASVPLGTHILLGWTGVSTNLTASNPSMIILDPGDWVWYELALPSSWACYVE
jgi:hypothetical protein